MEFKSIFDFIKTVPDEVSCIQYLEEIRWGGNVVSPYDESSKVYKCANNKYKCKNTGLYFNVRTGTIFEASKIALTKWFMALYVFASHKRGISSYQLAKDIGITQKSAWFLLHRLRYMFNHPTFKTLLTGTIEVDETYVGGKAKNKHSKKERTGRGIDKAPVVAMVERNGNVKGFVTPNVGSWQIYDLITKNIEKGSRLITDGFTSYKWVGMQYNHVAVKHNESYTTYGDKHTNTVEGFFSHLKRMLNGTYFFASRKHLSTYVNELAMRYNTRKISINSRFDFILTNMENRLTYKTLIAQ